MEKLAIIGNIGTDATIKEFNGKQFASFTVGVNSSYKNSDGMKLNVPTGTISLQRKLTAPNGLKKERKYM